MNKAQTATKITPHPLAGTKMTGAEMAVQVLSDEGVDVVFGYSGGAILPTYDAVFRFNEGRDPADQVRLVVPATEQGAGFMAAGYARASGKVGVFIVTSGPGATNAVTPIRDCHADSIPCVLITGQVPRAAMGTDAFQEAPVFNIMSACAKHVFLVTDETKIEETIRTAFELARTGRPGPVVVDLPRDAGGSLATLIYAVCRRGAELRPLGRSHRPRQHRLDLEALDEAEGEACGRPSTSSEGKEPHCTDPGQSHHDAISVGQ